MVNFVQQMKKWIDFLIEREIILQRIEKIAHIFPYVLSENE